MIVSLAFVAVSTFTFLSSKKPSGCVTENLLLFYHWVSLIPAMVAVRMPHDHPILDFFCYIGRLALAVSKDGPVLNTSTPGGKYSLYFFKNYLTTVFTDVITYKINQKIWICEKPVLYFSINDQRRSETENHFHIFLKICFDIVYMYILTQWIPTKQNPALN